MSLLLCLLPGLLGRPVLASAVEDPPVFTPSAYVYLPGIFTSPAPPPPPPSHQYLPVAAAERSSAGGCPAASTARWGQMAPRQRWIVGATQSPDLNLNVRGWYVVQEQPVFVSYPYPPDEPPDLIHPLHLSNIVPGSGVSSFVATYQINGWDWLARQPAPRNPLPYPVTMLGLRTSPGQPLHIPARNIKVDPAGFTAMVMYADETQIALKYTYDDRVDDGYLVHLLRLCVDPNLVGLYRELDRGGRLTLPGVHYQSVVGTALGNEVDVVVRDSGSFMDPRSWQDWWQDQPAPARLR